jgi:restriction system protein
MIDWNAILGKALLEVLKTLPHFLWACRYPLLMLGFIGAAKFAFRIWEQRRIAASGIGEIDRMDGLTFEKYLETLFVRLGYRVERTRYVSDYGADLVTRKDGVKTVIQAKRNRGKVGVKGIQEAVAAKAVYGCTAAMVVTNSTFTRSAVELARVNHVLLWDRERLLEAMLSLHPPVPEAVPAQAPVSATVAMDGPAASTPSAAEPALAATRCATCGSAVTEKVLAYCQARPEQFHGSVYCYDHQRTTRRAAFAVEEPVKAQR